MFWFRRIAIAAAKKQDSIFIIWLKTSRLSTDLSAADYPGD